MKNLVSFRELDSLGEGLVKDYAKKTHRWNSMCLDIEGFITDYLELRIVYESIAEEDKSKLGFMADGATSLRVTRETANMHGDVSRWRMKQPMPFWQGTSLFRPAPASRANLTSRFLTATMSFSGCFP